MMTVELARKVIADVPGISGFAAAEKMQMHF